MNGIETPEIILPETSFNFEAYAEALSKIILSEAHSKSLVIGIFGEWGTGKTCLMKTIEKKITSNSGSNTTKTIWFDAWKYNKEDAIWRALILRILEELKTGFGWDEIPGNDSDRFLKFIEQKFNVSWVREARIVKIENDKTIKVCFEENSLSLRLDTKKNKAILKIEDAKPYEFIAITENDKLKIYEKDLYEELDELQANLYKEINREELGALAFDWVKATKGTINLALSRLIEGGTKTEDVVSLFNSIFRSKKEINVQKVQFLEQFEHHFNNIIQKYYFDNKKRAVIFIDDLDRCLPEKALEVLEAIKLFMDVKGCIFILGMDKHSINYIIHKKYRGLTEKGDRKGDEVVSGENYLEKIIQLSFNLPPIEDMEMREFINSLISNSKIDKEYEPYIEMIIAGIEPNPRKMKRFFKLVDLQRNLAKALEIKETYLFSWDNGPEIDSLRLLSYLKEYPGMSFLENPHIETDKDERTIKFWTKEKSAEIKLDKKDKKATLKISDGITYPLQLKDENGKLFVYKDKLTEIEKIVFDALMIEWAVISSNHPQFRQAVSKKTSILIDIHKYHIAKDAGESLKELDQELKTFLDNDTLLAKLIVQFHLYVKSNPKLKKKHLFSWGKVPGDDNERLLRFLKDDLNIYSIENSKIEKKDNTISIKESPVVIKLDENNKKATLTASGGKIYTLQVVKEDNGELKIFKDAIDEELLDKIIKLVIYLSDVTKIIEEKPEDKKKEVETREEKVEEINGGIRPLTIAEFKEAKNLIGANLRGIYLESEDISKMILNGANLIGANLKGAILRETQLEGANLSGANLERADMTRANLKAAKLVRVKLDSANLNKIDLTNAKLNNAKLWYAKLREANLSNSSLKDAELYSADLSSADLTNADLYNAGLMSAHMEGTKMNGANLRQCNLKGAIFDNKTDFTTADIDSVTIDNLAGSNWEAALWDEDVKREITKKYGEGFRKS